MDEVINGLNKVNTRLGDLYMLVENYSESFSLYQKVIDMELTRSKPDHKFLSYLYIMKGSVLSLEGKPGTEITIIRDQIKALTQLLLYLESTGYDTSVFEIPTEEKCTVNRFAYLPLVGDSLEVKDSKESMS